MTAIRNLLSAPFRFIRWLWHWLTWPLRWLSSGWQVVKRFFSEDPDDTPLTDVIGDRIGNRAGLMGLWEGVAEHLTALRNHLFRAVLALTLTTALSAWNYDFLLKVIAEPVGGVAQLQVIEPTESVGVVVRVALLAGLVLAMPWLVLELYLFIAPGLMARTRIALLFVIPIASILFASGVVFTYFVMLPTAITFLRDFAGFQTAWRPSAYFGMITGLMFWVGVAFEMPLIIYILASFGLIRAKHLLQHWRIAVVVIAILAAIITPTTDPVNMGLVMLPMIGLYFISIVGAWVAGTNFDRQHQQNRD